MWGSGRAASPSAPVAQGPMVVTTQVRRRGCRRHAQADRYARPGRRHLRSWPKALEPRRLGGPSAEGNPPGRPSSKSPRPSDSRVDAACGEHSARMQRHIEHVPLATKGILADLQGRIGHADAGAISPEPRATSRPGSVWRRGSVEMAAARRRIASPQRRPNSTGSCE